MINKIKIILKKSIDFLYYCQDYLEFKKKADDRFSVSVADCQACLGEQNALQAFDAHYLFHPAWAARIISRTMPAKHVDISSILNFSTIISAFIPVEYYDYRPANLKLSNLLSERCDLVKLPFADNSIDSLSCMHTVEHIGLGRYGDNIDPLGDLKAIHELRRVVKIGGNLLVVVPVGEPKIKFNANRIYSFELIMTYFSGFELKDFSLITDKGDFINNADPSLVSKQLAGCGCFWLKKIN